ncbi:sucrose utilization protein SUC1-like protein 4 [Stagonosporopsis vannaccii]|nr:sucrose utilization protein SUC1-like protein 4 [Stagonosporopsis vannaccii]
MAATRKVVPKACDACRRRKIKCNGQQPCSGCMSATLTCAYDSPRKQGGNRGARAIVLNELRGNQQRPVAEPQATVASESPHSPLTTAYPPETSFVQACIDAYTHRIHQVVPILTSHALETEVQLAETSAVSRQFVLAFCAYVANFGNALGENSLDQQGLSRGHIGRQSLKNALQAQNLGRITDPSPRSMLISFFLYGAYAGLGDYQQGWFYLREATTLFTMLKADAVSWYDQRAHSCMFWILLISERSHGVRRNRPITLQVTASSPLLNNTRAPGLQLLASVFQPLDEIFFAVWNGSGKGCSKEWLLELERDVRTALPPTLELSNEEMANVRVSQFWLRIKLWELFPRFGFLSTASYYECLTFRYPIAVATDLTVLAIKLPIASLQVHGVGMTEKVFDIACAVADVLPFVSISASQMELGPIDYLTQVVSLLAKLPGGADKFVPLLLAKIHELRPELVNTLCAATQLPLTAFNDPMSPDTRFVYEEEVGRGLYADLRRAV